MSEDMLSDLIDRVPPQYSRIRMGLPGTQENRVAVQGALRPYRQSAELADGHPAYEFIDVLVFADSLEAQIGLAQEVLRHLQTSFSHVKVEFNS